QAEDGIRDLYVTGVQTCALPISVAAAIRFTDVTAGSGLEVVPALPDSVASSLERAVALAVGDYDDDATEDLFVAGHLFRGTLGRSEERRVGKECVNKM